MTRIERIETLRRDQLLAVRVSTDDGLQGIGQCAPYHVELTEQVLHTMVVPHVVGRDPWDLEALTEECLRANYKFLGGFLQRAVGGVETALWDLLGKATGQPVYRLLGGAQRDQVPVYASSMLRSVTPEQEASRLRLLIDEHGFRAAKIRVGTPMGQDTDAWPGRTEAIVAHLREQLGPDIALGVDANGGFSVGRAIQVGRLLEAHDYVHFEEPCPYPQLERTAEVTAALDITVAGGEQDTSLEQFARMIEGGVVDAVQPDIGYLGGLGRARKVAVMAEAAGIPCTPHCANHSLLQVFTLHLAAAMPSCTWFQEYSIESPDWTRDVYAPVPTVRDGVLELPTGPGWGVELTDAFQRDATRVTTG